MTGITPNLLLVGAHKSATTGLADDLAQQNTVYLPPIKEPHFFIAPEVRGRIPNCIDDWREYLNLFRGSEGKLWRMDASVLYLPYYEIAIPRILELLGSETHILISLRNPVDRAYSAYLDVARGNRLEDLSFAEAIQAEHEREQAEYGPPTMYYRQLGLYATQVGAFLRVFSNVHVVLFDEYVGDRRATLEGIATFLGIGLTHLPSTQILNAGGRVWASGLVKRAAQSRGPTRARRTAKRLTPTLYRRVRALASSRFMRPRAQPDPATMGELARYFRPDIERLQDVIGRDLSSWLGNGQRGEPTAPR